MIVDVYPEDEIQALIALAELTDPVETPNNNFYTFYPHALEEAQTYFRRFALDPSNAFEILRGKGLAYKGQDEWHLTPKGKAIADEIRRLRPPIWYWYKDFYAAIEHSRAFSEYCRRVYGRDLGQHGFSDLDQIHTMLDLLDLHAASRVLDVGCGNGKIAEYVSDLSGASVTGIDYVPEAIAQALARTRGKRDRLDFQMGNIDTLELRPASFDVVLSIDSIFFGRDLGTTLRRLARTLKGGGQMAIFCGEDLSALLQENSLTYQAYDLSREHYEHKQRKHRVALELRGAFERESNMFIWENQMAESTASTAPYDPVTCSERRTLYHLRAAGTAPADGTLAEPVRE